LQLHRQTNLFCCHEKWSAEERHGKCAN